jgi:adenylosuccinate synthase
MVKNVIIIVGLGYGDEGKGMATSYFGYRNKDSIVIRFNGGHQAGHTVVLKDGRKHVFSSFGSGTLQNIPTYWSRFCTFSPAYFLHEFNILPVRPILYLDQLSPVTTHYDVLFGRALEAERGEKYLGSCGVGFGATVKRCYHDQVKLLAGDLFDSGKYIKKLKEIRIYYKVKLERETHFRFTQFDHVEEDRKFNSYVEQLNKLKNEEIIILSNEEFIFSENKWNNYIFEGAQGILLDQYFGDYPYVTSSNTTSKNALELIRSNLSDKSLNIELYYITRAYHTRHGQGPFKQVELLLTHFEFETNKFNNYQGSFRTGPLDIDLVNYALESDGILSVGIDKNLIITCVDQVDAENLSIFKNGKSQKILIHKIKELLNPRFINTKLSYSPCSEGL